MGWNGSDRLSTSVNCDVADNTSASSKKNGRRRNGILISLITIVVGFSIWMFAKNYDTGKCTATVDNKSPIGNINSLKTKRTVQGVSVTKLHPKKTKAITPPEIEHSEIVIPKKSLGRPVEWKMRDVPIFTNKFESAIADILSTQPGEGFLSLDLPADLDAEYQDAVASAIVIGKDDPEEVVEIKKAVIAAKEEMRGYVSNGQKPSEVLSAAMLELSKIADYRDQVQQAFNQYLVIETDPKEILAYAKEANEMMDEYGALHIDAPDNVEAAYDLMIAAKECKTIELSDALKTKDEDHQK